jgi:hypothetical protein
MAGRQQVGTVMVDAGIIMIGDPCYTLPDDGSHRDEVARDWQKFVDKIYDGQPSFDAATPFGRGTAIVIPSGAGDGEYPVYVNKDRNGYVTSVTVSFR